MDLDIPLAGYLVGGVLVVIAILLGRSGNRNSLRARDISGNTIVGNVSGGVSQGNTRQPPIPAAKAASAPRDRIAWIIAIVGVLVALAQLAHDALK